MADSRTGQEMYKVSLEHLVATESKESKKVPKKETNTHNDGDMSGIQEPNQELPGAKARTI